MGDRDGSAKHSATCSEAALTSRSALSWSRRTTMNRTALACPATIAPVQKMETAPGARTRRRGRARVRPSSDERERVQRARARARMRSLLGLGISVDSRAGVTEAWPCRETRAQREATHEHPGIGRARWRL